jgi:transcriptional regulator GlxA family with amidase domain
MSKPANHNVVFVLFEGVQLLDVAGPAEALALASELHPTRGYDLRYIAPADHEVGSSAALQLRAGTAEETPNSIHTLIVPGAPMRRIEQAVAGPVLLDWLRATARRATRIASVCTGAFLLAEVGLLDGRRAATHWSVVERLAQSAPSATVDRDALFVEDGPIWTSAGVSTGIDLALALIERDLGPATALRVARELVVHLVRPGSQSQYSEPLELQGRAASSLSSLIPWIDERLHGPVTVEMMAQAAGMTERTLQRRCLAQFGFPPARLVTELRLERARTMLAGSAMPLSAIVAQTGFSDGTALSKAFKKRYGTAPSTYRATFGRPS